MRNAFKVFILLKIFDAVIFEFLKYFNFIEANVYARGKFIASKYVHPTMMLALRKTMESCDALSFIHMYNACGGGTGTGYTNKLADDCVDVFKMGNLMAFNIITSPTYKTAPTEYLNNLLYWGEGLIEASIKYCINFDNESMYSYIASQHSPTYWHVNQVKLSNSHFTIDIV